MSRDIESIWAEHREYVRRVLIGLSRDLDLADDLAQEVYLRASAGFGSYRGGDARAWLAAIARNAHHDHFRRMYTRSEVPYDDTTEQASDETLGSSRDVLLISIRSAVGELDPALRNALLLKHYGGFTYKEIAERFGCPVSTVKWRVGAAIDRLRDSLGVPQKEAAAMKCTDLTGAMLLDYLEGELPPRSMRTVGRHLEQCPDCAQRLEEIAWVLRALDLVEADWKSTSFIEIDSEGFTTGYMWLSMPNKADDPMESMTLQQNGLEYMTVQGEEVTLEPLPEEPAPEEIQLSMGMRPYKAHLPQPVPLGEEVRMHMVVKHPPGPDTARLVDDGHWRFGPGRLTLTEELLYAVAVRLPDQARLLAADPEPTEVKSDTHTTLVWRGILPPDGCFEFSADYEIGKG